MAEPTNTPTLPEYLALVTRVGLTSFGGGLSGWMLRLVVHERHWLTEADFLTGVGLCQVFPGINIVNLCIWLGYRMHGSRGAVAGALAIIVPPSIVIVALYSAFTGLSDIPAVRAVLDGVAAAAIGLGASMGLRAGWRSLAPGRRGRRVNLPAAVLLGATFGAIALAQMPLIPVLLVVVPVSIAGAWRGVGTS